MAKKAPVMQETRVRSWGQEDPLEEELETHSSTLAWRTPRTEEPGGLQRITKSRTGGVAVTGTLWRPAGHSSDTIIIIGSTVAVILITIVEVMVVVARSCVFTRTLHVRVFNIHVYVTQGRTPNIHVCFIGGLL